MRPTQFLEKFLKILEWSTLQKWIRLSPLLIVAVYWQSSNTKACPKKLSQILTNNIYNGGRGIGLRIYVRYCSTANRFTHVKSIPLENNRKPFFRGKEKDNVNPNPNLEAMMSLWNVMKLLSIAEKVSKCFYESVYIWCQRIYWNLIPVWT